MSTLYPTKTRLALLRDVARQSVDRIGMVSGAWFDEAVDEFGYVRTVTDKMRTLERAGWVELNGSKWLLTDAGRAVLDGAS